MKYLLPILLIFCTKLINAQIVLDESKQPIPFVDVLVLGDYTTFWQTNLNGKIPAKAILSLQANDTLVFHHISYNEKKISKADLKANDSIFLVQNNYELKEIQLSSKPPKYQKMKACFRSLVIQDNRALYYSDGTVDYLTKNKKLNYQLHRKAYRAFEHKKLAKYDVSHKVEVGISPALTPKPEESYLPYQMVEKYDLILIKSDSITTLLLTEDSLLIGEIKEQSNFIEYKINHVFLQRKRKAFNTEVDITAFYLYMVFRKQTAVSDNFLYKNFNQLLYYSNRYHYTIKHDKEKEKRVIENFCEFFIENISFLDEEDREYTKSVGMPRDSKYETEFWKTCDCKLYYPQNTKIFEDMRMR